MKRRGCTNIHHEVDKAVSSRTQKITQVILVALRFYREANSRDMDSFTENANSILWYALATP